LSSAKFHVSATRPDHQIFVPIPQPQTNQWHKRKRYRYHPFEDVGKTERPQYIEVLECSIDSLKHAKFC
jgi:hypothetical protein